MSEVSVKILCSGCHDNTCFVVAGISEMELTKRMKTHPTHPYNMRDDSVDYKARVRAVMPDEWLDENDKPKFRRAEPHETITHLSTRDGRLWVKLPTRSASLKISSSNS